MFFSYMINIIYILVYVCKIIDGFKVKFIRGSILVEVDISQSI